MRWIENLRQDISYGIRIFTKTPGFTAIVILTLALGIGANTAIFSIVNAVLLHPLPYKDSDRLVVIWEKPARDRNAPSIFDSYSDFKIWKSRTHSFEQLAVATWANAGQVFTGNGAARQVLAMPVSPEFFPLLGVYPELGRTFSSDDLNRSCTVVLRDRFWRSVLAGDKNAIGKSIRLNNNSCTVIGVMPPGFTFYPDALSICILITPADPIARDPDNANVGVFGRLRNGVSIENAQNEIQLIDRNEHLHDAKPRNRIPVIFSLQEEFTYLTGPNLRLSLIVLFAAVSFVLLIACVNVANLLLGRSLVRQRELAIRSAVGGGRGRLMRQLLTEGLIASCVAAALGTGLAICAVRYFRAANPVQMPPGTAVTVSFPVLLFTAGLAVFTALLFGLVPAWKSSRLDLNETLKTTGRGTVSGTAGRVLPRLMVMSEVMLSLVLLIGAGLLIKSVVQYASVPLGFAADHLITSELTLPEWHYRQPGQRTAFYDRLVNSIGALPGVEGVSLTTALPAEISGRSEALTIEAEKQRPGTIERSASEQSIAPNYFRVMHVPIERGRAFDSRDRENAEPVAIINQALVQKYFAHQDPIGRHIRMGEDKNASPWLTVVGVVANEKNTDFFHEMSWVENPTVFRSVDQTAPDGVSLVIRTAADLPGLSRQIQQRVNAIDPSVPVADPETMEHTISAILAYPRFRAVLLAVFAGLALLLAAGGLYGVLSQMVVQRTQEIGVRLALGACKADVLKLIAVQAMVLVGTGMIAGLVLAWELTRVLQALLYGVKTTDPFTLATVSFVFAVASLLASYIPARRAASVDPMVALKYE